MKITRQALKRWAKTCYRTPTSGKQKKSADVITFSFTTSSRWHNSVKSIKRLCEANHIYNQRGEATSRTVVAEVRFHIRCITDKRLIDFIKPLF